ncbi:MAG: sigma-54-dependent Fis family transcriptional regulator [Halioglobus sp.]|nr:sigma-54-dependent Fis family transcriptional regulator [Halioglobus sp.]
MSESLLIIEDEQLLGSELVRHYQRAAWDVEWVKTAADARLALFDKALEPLVVLSDLNLPDGNGLDLLEEARQRKCRSEWVFLTGYGGVPDSVRAIRLGACEFLTKPCDLDRLDLVISGAARGARAQRRVKDESESRAQKYTPDSFLGCSAQADAVRDLLRRLNRAPFSSLVITGETGTGKGLAARILHHGGQRAEGPLVEVNCAALPRDLLESELFGHEAGAFTGAKGRRRGLIEQAHGGTIFLDEIGEMPVDLQSTLLKVIEDHALRRLGGEREIRVDVRVLAATNQNLEEQIRSGGFRADLYHRLGVFKLELPPLRSRIEDLRALVPVFVTEYNAVAGAKVSEIPGEVWEKLHYYHWPGNIRELRNVVERCVLLATDHCFPVQWLQLESTVPPATGADSSADDNCLHLPLDGSMGLDAMVGAIIETVLERQNYNVTETSRLLKTTREKVRYRIEKYNIKSAK